jgi:hypothetical protein
MLLNFLTFIKGANMREEILESIQRMTTDDCKDTQLTCNLPSCKKDDIKRLALQDETIADYVLQY